MIGCAGRAVRVASSASADNASAGLTLRLTHDQPLRLRARGQSRDGPVGQQRSQVARRGLPRRLARRGSSSSRRARTRPPPPPRSPLDRSSTWAPPKSAAGRTAAAPPSTTPSTGIVSPPRTTTTSPLIRSSTSMSTSTPSALATRAQRGRAGDAARRRGAVGWSRACGARDAATFA